MSDNLLPCPFCGERAHMHAVNGPYCGNFECALHLVSGFNLDAWNKRAWKAARTVPALHAEQIRVAAVAAIREVTGCPDIKGKDDAYLVDALIVNLLSAAPEPKP